MKAVRLYGAKDLRVDDVEEPGSPEAGWVKLEIGWAGICGSDLHLYSNGPSYPVTPDIDRPQPVTGASLPITLGHEFSGTVIELGANVTDLEVGDKVAVMAGVSCGECVACQSGKKNICRNSWGLGLSGLGGGLSAYANVPASVAIKVGDMSLEHVAMIEPLSVATHGVRLAAVKQGDVVVIGGAGPIGVFAAAVATAKGAHVIISEPNRARREKALSAGVAAVGVDPMDDDLLAVVQRESNGRFADVAIDCAGVVPVIHDLIKTVRPGGRVQLIAIPGKALDLSVANEMHRTEIIFQGSYGYLPEDYRDSIEMVNSGLIDLDPFISAKIAPEHVVEKGFATLVDRSNTAVKILVRPAS